MAVAAFDDAAVAFDDPDVGFDGDMADAVTAVTGGGGWKSWFSFPKKPEPKRDPLIVLRRKRKREVGVALLTLFLWEDS